MFKVIVSPRAQKEIENAIEYYSLNSDSATAQFIVRLQATYDILKVNPFFREHYKNIRAIKISKYPYSLYFVISKETKIVKVLSCFHGKLDPTKKPKKP